MRILILGAGFAGLRAATVLQNAIGRMPEAEIALLDTNSYTTMIPALPDLAGQRVPAAMLTEELRHLVRPDIVRIITDTVTRIDLTTRQAEGEERLYDYDFLIIATGSVTDLFGFNQHLEAVHTLDSRDGALSLSQKFVQYLSRCGEPHAVVVGGGYTGLELACNLQHLARRSEKACRLSVVELQDHILPALPDDIRSYMEKKTSSRGIQILPQAKVETFDGHHATLNNGVELSNIFLCWSTGTKFAIADVKGNFETLKDGRLKVMPGLNLAHHPEVFAAGDSAAMKKDGQYLRKAVNFSIYSGQLAGRNIIRVLNGQAPEPFNPSDLGWVIPFCTTGAGKLFGRYTVRGRLPLSLHYFMCGFRNYNWPNRRRFWKITAKAWC